MKRLLLVILVLIAVVGGIGLVMMTAGGPDLSVYEPLRQPQINVKPNQKVIEAELTGAPDAVSGKAIGALMQTYFSLEGVSMGSPVAPRARWSNVEDTPKEQWVGQFAMPVPNSVEQLPEDAGTNEVKVRLAEWQYGKMAEILHVGPYDQETPTIEKLKAFIDEQGYEIAGPHEEEYIKGPGMFLSGDPKEYYTVIRYPVQKKAVPEKTPESTDAPETPAPLPEK